MGVLWTVWPLDQDIRQWLDTIRVPYPSSEGSRFPSGNEVKNVVTNLSGYEVEITDNGVDGPWQALITQSSGLEEGPWTLLNITNYTGDEEPQEIWFEKGWENLIAHVVDKLATSCGPLVLIPDTSEEPKVIWRGDDGMS